MDPISLLFSIAGIALLSNLPETANHLGRCRAFLASFSGPYVANFTHRLGLNGRRLAHKARNIADVRILVGVILKGRHRSP